MGLQNIHKNIRLDVEKIIDEITKKPRRFNNIILYVIQFVL